MELDASHFEIFLKPDGTFQAPDADMRKVVGPFGLTYHQIAIFQAKAQDKSVKQIEAEIGNKGGSVSCVLRRARITLGVNSDEAAIGALIAAGVIKPKKMTGFEGLEGDKHGDTGLHE